MTGGTPTGMHSNVMGRKRAPGAEFLPWGVLQNHGLLAAPTRRNGMPCQTAAAWPWTDSALLLAVRDKTTDVEPPSLRHSHPPGRSPVRSAL